MVGTIRGFMWSFGVLCMGCLQEALALPLESEACAGVDGYTMYENNFEVDM